MEGDGRKLQKLFDLMSLRLTGDAHCASQTPEMSERIERAGQ